MSHANPVDQVRRFVERFVFFKNPQIYLLVTLWVMGTHLYKIVDYMGYLFAYSAQPQSGKSRLLEILDLLVAISSGLLIDPSEAVLFRTAAEGTQLLDEVDTWGKKAEYLRGILNAGFHCKGSVKRSEQLANGRFRIRTFPVYAPRALAGNRSAAKSNEAVLQWRCLPARKSSLAHAQRCLVAQLPRRLACWWRQGANREEACPETGVAFGSRKVREWPI